MKELMTPDELSEYTGTPVQTLAHGRSVGRGPRFVKLGGAVRYRAEDVAAWIDSQVDAEDDR